jgi:hypothetical protein
MLRRSRLLKHITEGNIEGRIKVTGRRGRRRKQLLDDFKEARGYRKLKQEALNHTCGELALKRLWTYRKTDHERNETRGSFRVETLFFFLITS